jgi:Zn-dependent M32 family carboxypeptidase
MKIKIHKEAIELQTKLEDILNDIFEEGVELSMALTGKLKVSIDSNYICFNKDYKTVDYIRYEGDYNILIDYINKLISVFDYYKSDFDNLMDSYENISKLK